MSQPVSQLDVAQWQELAARMAALEAAWRESPPADLADHLPPLADPVFPFALREGVKVDQEMRWRRGEKCRLEHYLERWPHLAEEVEVLVELIEAECLTRAIYDRPIRFQELRERFPRHCEKVSLARIATEASQENAARSGDSGLEDWSCRSESDILVGTILDGVEVLSVGVRSAAGRYLRGRAATGEDVEIGLPEWDRASAPLGRQLWRRLAQMPAVLDDEVLTTGERKGVPYVVRRTVSRPIRDGAHSCMGCAERKPMSLLSEGLIIRGTYEVERYLGSGAFAEVYRVKHRFLGRQAMKVFKMVGMTIDEIEKMLGEALLLSRFGHPNIVRVFDANVVDTSLGICGFFTMEYIAGGSLEQFWRSHGARFVPTETAVEVVRQVCRGLAAAHGESPPIVHRDIKPQNILVGYEATGLRARVGDFGLARHVNPLTMMASARGTPVFKAPEVFRDVQSDSLSGDVWGVGATLYMLLTDQLPYACENEADLLSTRRFDKPLPPPSRFNPMVDAALDAIILKSLAVDVARRYQDAGELLRALEKWSPHGPPAANPPPDNQATADWRGSKADFGALRPQVDEGEAQRLAKKALELARQSGRLNDAADVMEEAFNKWPDLRSQYQSKVQLWRMGVAM